MGLVAQLFAHSLTDPNVRMPTGRTPLYYAVMADDQKFVALLLSNERINVNVQDRDVPLSLSE
jgi:ankyrin repeat protein